MLTISQLAAHAGVTVRAVRHYHQIGLLAEPERTTSGYRTYDAAAVVRLIRIRILAGAGVPLARIQDLLDASPEAFAAGVEEVDRELQAEIQRLQDNRTRIADLAAGERLALPPSVVDYLDRLRRLGVDGRYIVMERDAWIMVAAQAPDTIDMIMAKKHEELDDPDMVLLYRLFSEGLDLPKSAIFTSRSGSLLLTGDPSFRFFLSCLGELDFLICCSTSFLFTSIGRVTAGDFELLRLGE